MTAALFTPVLAANVTAAVGTNYDIVTNHTVIAGDILANIATSTNSNSSISKPPTHGSRMWVTSLIFQTQNVFAPAATPPPTRRQTATCSNGTTSTIKVVAGDTMIIIAKEKLGITSLSLLAANLQVKSPDLINLGDVLNITHCGKNGNVTGTSSSRASETSKAREHCEVSRAKMLANEQSSHPRNSNSNILDLAEFVGHLRVRQAHGTSFFETFLKWPCCSSIKS
jgi:LysM repeat protein